MLREGQRSWESLFQGVGVETSECGEVGQVECESSRKKSALGEGTACVKFQKGEKFDMFEEAEMTSGDLDE